MKGCPLEYQRHGSPREVSPEDGKRLYFNEGLVFAIFGMEMCGSVVSKVHSNHNPIESSYLRHFLFPFYLLRPRRVRRGIGPCNPPPRSGLLEPTRLPARLP